MNRFSYHSKEEDMLKKSSAYRFTATAAALASVFAVCAIAPA